MAFVKHKTMLRNVAERTIEAFWVVIGHIADTSYLFECTHYFSARDYIHIGKDPI